MVTYLSKRHVDNTFNGQCLSLETLLCSNQDPNMLIQDKNRIIEQNIYCETVEQDL